MVADFASIPRLRPGLRGPSLFISTYEELERFCERASSSPVLAVDTEFLRERTYRPRLCLIQLATSADDIAAVDPIAIRDLSPIARPVSYTHLTLPTT